MASEGPYFGADFADQGFSWSGIANLDAVGGGFASATVQPEDVTSGVIVSDFGFAIPSGATIDGVLVELYDLLGDVVLFGLVGLTKDGVNVAGSTEAATVGAAGWQDVGGPTTMFGTTLSYTEVNATTFGAVISVGNLSQITAYNTTLDAVRTTVYYTASLPPVTDGPKLHLVRSGFRF